MSTVTRIFVWLFTQSLKLYPSDFRAEFGDEMTAVFTRTLSEAQQRGWISLLIWCGREFTSLFAALMREQWLSLRREEALMNQMLNVNYVDNVDGEGTQTPVSWTETMAGILPFILFGLLFTLKGVNYHTPLSWMEHSMYWYLIVHFILIVGLGVGWAKNFPRWSYAYLSGTLMSSY